MPRQNALSRPGLSPRAADTRLNSFPSRMGFRNGWGPLAGARGQGPRRLPVSPSFPLVLFQPLVDPGPTARGLLGAGEFFIGAAHKAHE